VGVEVASRERAAAESISKWTEEASECDQGQRKSAQPEHDRNFLAFLLQLEKREPRGDDGNEEYPDTDATAVLKAVVGEPNLANHVEDNSEAKHE
jgi:hypothetical protein